MSPDSQLEHRRTILFVLALGLVIRLGIWLAYLDRPDTFVQPDTHSYLEPGIQLLQEGSFPSYSRTPVYPLFLGVASKIISPDPSILVLVQIALSLVTMILIGNLCSQFFGTRITLLVLVFMALDLTSAISANHLLSETLFTFLLSACLAGLVHFHNGNRLPNSGLIVISLTGLGFSVLTLCRPIAIFLFIVIAFWIYLTYRKRRFHISTFILCFCVCSMLFPFSWILRNHADTGVYFLSTIPSANIFEYRAAWNISRITNRPFDAVRYEFEQKADIEKQRLDLNEGELARWKELEGIQNLKDHPLFTLYQGFDGLIKMYLGISAADINNLAGVSVQNDLKNSVPLITQYWRHLDDRHTPVWIAGVKLWAMLYFVLLYCGVAFAIIEIIRRPLPTQQRYVLWLMILVIAYFTLLSIGAESYSRFRVPVTPALSVIGAFGWVEFVKRFTYAKNTRNPDASQPEQGLSL